jgi:DNA-binding FadR family transcriptional regulator
MRRASEELEAAEARIEAAEARAAEAEIRADAAEEWLRRFHDAITEGFHNPRKAEARPRAPAKAAE